MSIAILPKLDHFNLFDAENVYEPSDDTFLLCDTIKNDIDSIISIIQSIEMSRTPYIVEVYTQFLNCRGKILKTFIQGRSVAEADVLSRSFLFC